MALTALAIRNAQPRAKPYKLTDERSLFLLVMPNGAKYWRFRYRFLDKQKTLAIGVWPEISLADARVKRDSARQMVADGIDPNRGGNPHADRLERHMLRRDACAHFVLSLLKARSLSRNAESIAGMRSAIGSSRP